MLLPFQSLFGNITILFLYKFLQFFDFISFFIYCFFRLRQGSFQIKNHFIILFFIISNNAIQPCNFFIPWIKLIHPRLIIYHFFLILLDFLFKTRVFFCEYWFLFDYALHLYLQFVILAFEVSYLFLTFQWVLSILYQICHILIFKFLKLFYFSCWLDFIKFIELNLALQLNTFLSNLLILEFYLYFRSLYFFSFLFFFPFILSYLNFFTL